MICYCYVLTGQRCHARIEYTRYILIVVLLLNFNSTQQNDREETFRNYKVVQMQLKICKTLLKIHSKNMFITIRNRPVQGFGCRTGNSRKLNLNPVCRILPDRKQVFLTENFKLPDLAGNFNFLEYGYLFDRKFLSTKINFFILTQKTTSIITE